MAKKRESKSVLITLDGWSTRQDERSVGGSLIRLDHNLLLDETLKITF